VFKSEHSASVDAAEALGTRVAEDLIAQGGDKVLGSLGIEAKSI
jgi:hypothetical protein